MIIVLDRSNREEMPVFYKYGQFMWRNSDETDIIRVLYSIRENQLAGGVGHGEECSSRSLDSNLWFQQKSLVEMQERAPLDGRYILKSKTGFPMSGCAAGADYWRV